MNTEAEWENFITEINLITQDRSSMPYIWLSATEGDKHKKLARLDHWPETELAENETKKLEAVETVWRDFYTGERLNNWSKPFTDKSIEDTAYGDNYNCIQLDKNEPWHKSWYEWQCYTFDSCCPCSFPAEPLLRLRGLCKNSLISKISNEKLFTPKQLPGNPRNVILLGDVTTRIEYNDTSRLWVLTDVKSDVTAVSRSTKLSYLLGKHPWTISNDDYECNEGKPYTTMLKLSGCKGEGEFTCDDGQCIKMEERCNQVPDCRDESDERECKVIILKDSYNKIIPPIRRGNAGIYPANVSISISLMKIVEIEETDHSILLQFQISLQWKENRAKFQNLKKESSLNALTEEDIKTIWLPLIVYDNTDQKQVTRLGEYGNGEWVTRVTATREGNFTSSGIDKVDEAEIFEGAENRLTMNQTYTWRFQCKYEL